jgi:hypothetical protein
VRYAELAHPLVRLTKYSSVKIEHKPLYNTVLMNLLAEATASHGIILPRSRTRRRAVRAESQRREENNVVQRYFE